MGVCDGKSQMIYSELLSRSPMPYCCIAVLRASHSALAGTELALAVCIISGLGSSLLIDLV